MIKTKFKNEFGRNIVVKVKSKRDTDDEMKFDAVSISITGPDSEAENIVTKKEAYEIYKALEEYFNKNKQKSIITGGGVIKTMGISEPHASDIKSGKKIMEGRLNTPPLNKIQKGDIIIINHKSPEKFNIKVTFVKRYKSFSDMIKKEGLENVLPSVDTLDEGIQVYRKFYPEWKEQKYGIIAIGMKLL